jgi:hypothetical protein
LARSIGHICIGAALQAPVRHARDDFDFGIERLGARQYGRKRQLKIHYGALHAQNAPAWFVGLDFSQRAETLQENPGRRMAS